MSIPRYALVHRAVKQAHDHVFCVRAMRKDSACRVLTAMILVCACVCVCVEGIIGTTVIHTITTRTTTGETPRQIFACNSSKAVVSRIWCFCLCQLATLFPEVFRSHSYGLFLSRSSATAEKQRVSWPMEWGDRPPPPLWLHLCVYGRIRNPQQRYVKRVIH